MLWVKKKKKKTCQATCSQTEAVPEICYFIAAFRFNKTKPTFFPSTHTSGWESGVSKNSEHQRKDSFVQTCCKNILNQ